jgi:pimeloyl-ACP methyl ester carboxylesterase
MTRARVRIERSPGGASTLLAAVILLSGCEALRPATAPIATIERHVGGGDGGSVLLVLFHGRGDGAKKFFDEGFDRVAAQSGIRFDLVSVEAHLGYYVRGQLEIRIGADVLGPARARGYEKIWLVGTSMGGLGALACAQRHPEAVDGVILLAPYLGSRRILEYVEKGTPLVGKLEGEDRRTKEMWDWILQTPAAKRQTVLVGVGDRDPFLSADRLFGSFQPPGQFETIPGGHDWNTWKLLFRWALAHPGGPVARASREAKSSVRVLAPRTDVQESPRRLGSSSLPITPWIP